MHSSQKMVELTAVNTKPRRKRVPLGPIFLSRINLILSESDFLGGISMKLPVYLDYAATTPVDPRVAKKMAECLCLEGTFGNPASKSHIYGWQAAEAVDIARGQIADLIGADTREIVFTSGATECDNLAVTGVALASLGGSRKKIITSAIEHKAVLDPCHYAETLGYEVVYLKPDADGLVTPEMLEEQTNG